MTAPATKDVHCPRCLNSKMLEQTWQGIAIRICMSCGANLFQAGELAAWEGWKRDIPASAERAAVHAPTKIHCPLCETRMEHVTFPTEPPLEIERCTGCHGILLDFEEIRRIPEIGRWAAAHRSPA
jgi:Zn-finger nucleic acid-binding protein